MTRAFLTELSSDHGSRHPATAEAVIGREDCEIAIADPEVSRRHAAIRAGTDGMGIEDLGSRNGTYVNEQRISGLRVLAEGDEVRVGDTVLRFETEASGARPAAVARSGARGDVPAPDAVPSVVRAAPPVDASAPPSFRRTPRRIRGSAARRGSATVISFAVVLVDAVAVIAYLAAR